MDLNRIAPDHLQLAVTGMTVVFAALTLIAVFIYSLPRVLAAIDGVFPTTPDQLSSANEEEEQVAAVGFALHHQRTQSTR
ncbi:MAG: hypothetical protein VX346_14360 [Planctomycetota bacterium]|nr:hypothetical protein [Planctomycetota bacterium]